MKEYGVWLSREDVRERILLFTKGVCPADIHDPDRPRNYDWHMDHVIDPLVKGERIDDGSKSPYDDRKLRMNKPIVEERKIVIPIGATHFYRLQADQKRDSSLNKVLREQGETRFDDKYAFFAATLGVTVVPRTREGYILLGPRTNSHGTNELNAVSGFLPFVDFRKESMLTIGAVHAHINTELEEEWGVGRRMWKEEPRFVGASYSLETGETDLSFLLDINLSEEELKQRWDNFKKEEEHSVLFTLKSPEEIRAVLEEGKVPDTEKKFEVFSITAHPLRELLESQ